jgi:hypothetical protein
MKKLLSIIAMLSVVISVGAHEPPGELFVAVQFPAGSEPTIDGDDSDWSAVPLEQYGIFSDLLYSIHGFAGENIDRGGLDASSMQIRHIVGWSASTNNLYMTSRVYDNIHVTVRQDPGRFYWDDSFEYEVSPQNLSRDENNQGESANSFSYKFAFPVFQETFEWYRPNRNLPWLTAGSQWVDVAASYEGEEFGESTYTYEARVLPINSMPKSEEATEAQVEVHTLSEGEVIHMTLTINDVDGGEGDEDNRIGMWSTSPVGCCHADSDFLMAPADPAISWGATAVESSSWGRIKAQF